MTFPRLIAPFFKLDYKTAYSIPNSRLKLNYNLQQRALYYTLNSFLLSYGYTWSANRFVSWEFNPISINYMNVSNKTGDFEDILNNNQFLARSFDDQFIPAITANFQYSEIQKPENSMKSTSTSAWGRRALLPSKPAS
ncbi:MAG: hypothetical protein U5L96_20255 [Owenweeksia sp.]|nr:hypothetical protein [Owenweeksia sp.]